MEPEWYGDGPTKYTATVTLLVAGHEETVTWDMRPACPGAFASESPGCDRRPDHVVSYSTNPSGLPGSGTWQHVPACYRHLHGVIVHAEKSAYPPSVLVSEYKGI